MGIPPAPMSANGSTTLSPGAARNNGALIGGLVGGLVGGAALIAAVLGAIAIRRRRRQMGGQAKEPSKLKVISTDEFYSIEGSNLSKAAGPVEGFPPSGKIFSVGSEVSPMVKVSAPASRKLSTGLSPSSALVADLCLPRGPAVAGNAQESASKITRTSNTTPGHSSNMNGDDDSELADMIVRKAYKRLAQTSSFQLNRRSIAMLGLCQPSATAGSMVSPFAFMMDASEAGAAAGKAGENQTHLGHGPSSLRFDHLDVCAESISNPTDSLGRSSIKLTGKVAELNIAPGVNFQLDWER